MRWSSTEWSRILTAAGSRRKSLVKENSMMEPSGTVEVVVNVAEGPILKCLFRRVFRPLWGEGGEIQDGRPKEGTDSSITNFG
jgi:hypothetical protein